MPTTEPTLSGLRFSLGSCLLFGPLFAFLFLLSGCIGSGPVSGDFAEDLERVWIGPEYFANRLADWRLDRGRVECVEGRRNWPLRTLFRLDRALAAGRGWFTMSVLTGPLDSGQLPAEAWRGFLIGGGGEDVDWRLTAWTHHKPARDGGLLAVVDGWGGTAFRDMSQGSYPAVGWGISGPVAENEVPVLAADRPQSPALSNPSGPVLLTLAGRQEEDGWVLTLSALDPAFGAEVSRTEYRDVPARFLDGGIALVSHHGPQGSERGYWFEDWTLRGPKITSHPDRLFGPVLSAQYTVSRKVLTLTAQLGPLGPDDERSLQLQLKPGGSGPWRTVAETEWVSDSYTATFRIEDWPGETAIPFRVLYDLKTSDHSSERYAYDGTIRAEPDEDEYVVAAFTGHKCYTGGLEWNHNGYWFPHNEIVAAVTHHDPDFLFFSGDQVYEGDLTPAIRNPVEDALLDYLYKWYRWCWAFADLTRERPSVSIPDDHDVYHGNIWGAGGKKAEASEGMTAQDSGGYRLPPRFVNAVHRTQTSHLPPPYDPAPVEQGISVYYTDVTWGGVSFAVLADRQFKSSPTVAVPAGQFVNGWPQASGFDPACEADTPGAVLLGRRQLDFLHAWAADWSGGTWMKAVLSQTVFANVATIPQDAASGSVIPGLPYLEEGEYPRDYKLTSDGDSNGWPPSGRNRALREMRRACAVHIAGDQHLGSTIQYGVEAFRDAGFALCVPSVGNTWPRRWFPPQPGRNRKPGSPEYTGDFFDGFGNRMTVHAVSNPHRTHIPPENLHNRAPGYGIVRFVRSSREIVIECWPRWVDPSQAGARQYPGWPVTCHQLDNDGRGAWGWLPVVEVSGLTDPVVQVIAEADGEILYTLRISGTRFEPKVFAPGDYSVVISDPDNHLVKRFPGLKPMRNRENAGSLTVTF